MPRPSRPQSRACRPYADKVAIRPDALVADLASEQWGVLSLDELRACGLSRDMVSDRVRAGHLHPLHRGVYAVGHANPPLNGRFLAAVKACGPTAVLSHFSAAALYGFLPWDDRSPEITSPRSHKHPGIRAHRTLLDPRDVTRHETIPTTTPARTLHDLSSKLPFQPLRRATRQAHALRLVSTRQLTDVLARARRPTKLARIVATGLVPTRSELEDAVLDLIAAGGLQPPDVNVPLRLDGRLVIPDFRWPAERLVIEADGAAWHDHRLAREDDVERQALLEAHGERVVRVTWDQAIRQRSQTLARLKRAGAPRLQPS
jgi:very-short-patch-repair endonuclease